MRTLNRLGRVVLTDELLDVLAEEYMEDRVLLNGIPFGTYLDNVDFYRRHVEHMKSGGGLQKTQNVWRCVDVARLGKRAI